METLLVFIFIIFMLYIVPAIVAYLWVRHKFKTEWTLLQPGIDDFLMVFIPILNIGTAFFGIMEILLVSAEETFDTLDSSKTNEKIKNKQVGKKFFRL